MFAGPGRRRRPLARAAVIGGTAAYAGNRAGKNSANAAASEADQEARLEQLEAQQAQAQPQYAAPPQQYAAPAPAAPASAGDDLVSQLTSLKGLLDAGALTQPEFDAAKAKLLAA